MKREPPTSGRATRAMMPGVFVAGLTALLSGVSVFVNSYGLHSFSSPGVYTTAKNLVATMVLGVAATVSWRHRQRHGSMAANFVSTVPGSNIAEPSVRSAVRRGPRVGRWLGLSYVGLAGGGLAFVLFFNGLATSQPATAAFWRDTLVVWVAVLAFAVLRERVRWWNIAAVTLLIAGEVTVTGGVGQLSAHRGELAVLGATVLWAVEVVIAKRLLRTISPAILSLVRMGVGGLALMAYLAVDGTFGSLAALNAGQLAWVGVTGVLLSAYVATWMTALARARALDVTSVLVASAPLTWLLQLMAGSVIPVPASLGLVLIGAGTALTLWARPDRKDTRPNVASRT